MANSLDHAWALHTQGKHKSAIALCNQLLSRHPDHPAVLCCRAMSQWSLGEGLSAAKSDMEKSVAGAPKVGGLRHNLATILASLGDIDGAQRQFKIAIEINPNDAQAFFSLTQNMRYSQIDDIAAGVLARIESNDIDPKLLQFAHYGLAKVFDDIGAHSLAFHHARIANSLDKRPYNFDAERQRFERLKSLAETFDVPGIESSLDTLAPIFIVGMPRSGTTLVESILSRHPAVFAHGEQSLLPKIEAKFLKDFGGDTVADADAILSNVPPDQFLQHAIEMRDYFQSRVGGSATYFTDKLPHNAERIGLVSKMFPNARIIHVKRHPLDSGLSNYFTRFNSGNGYANDLGNIGTHFANVSKTLDLWAGVPGINVLRLRYEDLVADPRACTENLLNYLELAWAEECLDPSKGQKGILTASQWQVRQPIYQGSVDKWRNYEDAIAPMLDAVGGPSFIDKYMSS